MHALFRNREEAGKILGQTLNRYLPAAAQPSLVLGLPRGGVPVAFEVASLLHAPLDVFLVRKLGVPGQEELAMGAIASGGTRILNPNILSKTRVTAEEIESATLAEKRELERRERIFRGTRGPLQIERQTVLIVDDGLATGATMQAAIRAVRTLHPQHIFVGVPVAPPDSCRELRALADAVVCVHTPEPFLSVGQWYRDFTQTSDEQVIALLEAKAPSLNS